MWTHFQNQEICLQNKGDFGLALAKLTPTAPFSEFKQNI